MEGDIVRVTSVVAIGTCWTRLKGKKISSRASESCSPIQQDRKRVSSNSSGRSSSSSSGTVSVVGYAEVLGPEQSSAKKLLFHFMRRSQADTRRFDPANRTADPDSQVSFSCIFGVCTLLLCNSLRVICFMLSSDPRPGTSLFKDSWDAIYAVYRHGTDHAEHIQHFAAYGSELCVAVS